MYNRLVLVDSSYTSFYRFFATLRWFSFANKEEWKKLKLDIEYDWSQNKIFIDKYKKMYFESIQKIIGKKKLKNSIIVFCLDSKQSTLWRNKFMDNYKGDRTDLSKKNNFKPTFKMTYSQLIPSIVKQNDNIFSVKVETAEADDVIAILTNKLKQINEDFLVDIISGDEDFKQLGRTNVTFHDYRKSKKPVILTITQAKLNLLNKIVCGDKSDNIKCIFSTEMKVTKKMRLELINNPDKLSDYLSEHKKINKQFKLNKKMIDFTQIPKSIQNKILKNSKEILDLIS